MEYTGKYKEMAEQFRKDGCDEYTIKKFIRREMEADEFAKRRGISEIEAMKIWKDVPQVAKNRYLNNAFCFKCGKASFKRGYNIRKDVYGIVIEGICDKCGGEINRVCD